VRLTCSIGIPTAVGLFLFGCTPQLDCARLGKKLATCKTQVYERLGGPAETFLDQMTAPTSPLTLAARQELAAKWKHRKVKEATRLTDRIEAQCRKHHGRYAQSKALAKCLDKTSCSKFAQCFVKAAGRTP